MAASSSSGKNEYTQGKVASSANCGIDKGEAEADINFS